MEDMGVWLGFTALLEPLTKPRLQCSRSLVRIAALPPSDNRNAGGIMSTYAWGRSGLLNDKSSGLIFVRFVTFIRITSMLSGIRFN